MTEANWQALSRCTAVLFDLDGVLTPTAEVHMHAWRGMFTRLFDSLGVEPAYSDADYFDHLDGRPRYDGVGAVLASRGIALPFGEPSDGADQLTVCGLGNRKNAVFDALLTNDGVVPYPGSVAFLDRLARAGIASAVVSSSRNARAVLAAAGLAGRFDVVVDGNYSAAEGLAGKPAPDTYLRGAALLRVSPSDTAVVEDAISGVQAGAAGGFVPVVGVDRGTGSAALASAGATIVVTDLAELLPGAVRAGRDA